MPEPDTNNPATFVTGVFSTRRPETPTILLTATAAGPVPVRRARASPSSRTTTRRTTGGLSPTHAFNAPIDVGKAYTLTVAVVGGTDRAIPMQEGTTLHLSLYYRDGESNLVTVGAHHNCLHPRSFPQPLPLCGLPGARGGCPGGRPVGRPAHRHPASLDG